MESSSKPIPNIIHLEEKKLIGLSRAVSLNDNETGMLWKSFMQRRSAITNANGPELYSISVYPHLYFESFDPGVQFTKWATVAVTSYDDLPTHMDTYILQSGLVPGCHSPDMIWMIGLILKYWEKNIKTMIPIRRKWFVYQSNWKKMMVGYFM